MSARVLKNPSQALYSFAKNIFITISDLLPNKRIILHTELKITTANQYIFCSTVTKNEAIKQIINSDTAAAGLNVEPNGIISYANSKTRPMKTFR